MCPRMDLGSKGSTVGSNCDSRHDASDIRDTPPRLLSSLRPRSPVTRGLRLPAPDSCWPGCGWHAHVACLQRLVDAGHAKAASARNATAVPRPAGVDLGTVMPRGRANDLPHAVRPQATACRCELVHRARRTVGSPMVFEAKNTGFVLTHAGAGRTVTSASNTRRDGREPTVESFRVRNRSRRNSRIAR